ncbi:tRNA (cytidine/uridine/adenosine-2'-O-)-methyltransferase TrmJ [uncultured bacterium]|nr:tRNA (cytidine/uridine/adenosine-2'-O-)-methyltransferase TrmJ [uncultured bacterium]
MGRSNKPKKKAPKPPANSNISIVLVEPQSSGNVGSVARAMRNTDFTDLVLINPCDYKNNESYSMACKADDVLARARVFPTLESYIGEPSIVVGTTRRVGRNRFPVMTLAEAVPVILRLAASNRVGILFGREDKGLRNEEIPPCDILVEIPTSEDYPSINLSHAVFTVCHHLFTAQVPKADTIKAAPKEEVEKMYAHIERTLKGLGYGDAGGEYLLEAIMRNFKRLFGRTGLMLKEVNMLRGILSQVEKRAVDGEEGHEGPEQADAGERSGGAQGI